MEGLKIHGIYEARKGGKRAQDEEASSACVG